MVAGKFTAENTEFTEPYGPICSVFSVAKAGFADWASIWVRKSEG